MIKNELIKELNSMGYITISPNHLENSRFYEFKKDKETIIGMKVGQYTHSCHVDSSDIYVLLCLKRNTNEYGRLYDTYVTDVWDIWAKEV